MTVQSGPYVVGPTNSLADVPGLSVGHRTRRGRGWLTGTTVVLAGPGGAVGGVDVRGGGPGTRETDLLDPRNLVERVHAVVLTGGSAFGLAAADGVMQRLAARGIGLAVSPDPDAGLVVPIVPAAVLFDLARGGSRPHWPGPAEGAAAVDAASAEGAAAQGAVGAGTGAVAGGLKGGIGTASAVLPTGATVAALVAVNSAGSPVDLTTGELYATRFTLGGDLPDLVRPKEGELRRHAEAFAAAAVALQPRPGTATTIGVLATDLTLTKAQCAKVAGVGHDGLARGIQPVHTMVDGDTLFTLATGDRPTPDLGELQQALLVAADCVTRAVARAMLAAASVHSPAGRWASYADTFPSAVRPVSA